MASPLKVLILEDKEKDARLALRELKNHGYDVSWQRVETKDAFCEALASKWDVVLADYDLPSFSAPEALLLFQQTDLDIPFIVVSGVVGEETAVQTIKLGAHDYVMKDRLVRLAPAVERELQRAHGKRQLAAAEQHLKTERTHREGLQWIRDVLDGLPTAAYTCNVDGLITYYNEQSVELWGREPTLNDPVDRYCSSFKLYSPDGSPLEHARCWMALAIEEDKEYREQEIVIERPDGTRRNALAHANPIHDETGKQIGAVNVLVDITQRKRDELALRESESRFRTLCSQAPVGIYTKDADGNCLYANEQALRTIGLKFEQVAGLNWTNAIHPDDYERVLQQWTQTQQRGEEFFAEYRFRTPNGKVTWVQSSSAPQKDSDGQLVGFIGTIVDITNRKQAEQKLATQALQQRVVAELGQLAIAETELGQLLDTVTTAVAKTLDVENCKILELVADRTKFLLKSGVGWRDGLVGTALVDAGKDSQASYTLFVEEPVIVADLRTEQRFQGPPLLTEHGVVSGMSVIIGALEQPYGVLGVHTVHQRSFTDDEVRFIAVVANLLAQAINRRQLEDSLRQANEELEERVAQRTESLATSVLELKTEVNRREQAEQVAREGEERFRQLAENVDAVFWMRSGDGREQIYVSPKYETVWQRSLDSLRANPDSFIDSVHPEDRPRLLQNFAELETGADPREYNVEYRIFLPDGQTRWIHDRAYPLFDLDGNLARQIGLAEDITQRKCTTLLLAGQNRVLEMLAHGEPLDDVISALLASIENVDPDLIASVLLLDDENCVHRVGRNRLPDDYNEAIEGQKIGPQHGSCGTCAYRGERVIVEDILTHPYWENYRGLATPAGLRACWSEPIRSSTGVVLGTFALYYRTVRAPNDADLKRIHNLAHVAGIAIERAHANEKLFESEAKYRLLVESSPYCIHQINLNGRLVSMNHTGLQLMGVRAEAEIRGMEYLSIVCLDDRQRIAELLHAARNGEASEFEFQGASGAYYQSSFVPIFGDDGDVTRLMGLSLDITARKHAEQTLRESEEKWRSLITHAPGRISMLDRDGRIQFINRVGAGFEKAEVEGQLARDFLAEAFRPVVEQALRQVFDHQEAVEFEAQAVTGAWYSNHLGPLFDDGQVVGAMLMAVEVTKSKQMESDLQAKSDRLEAIFAASPDLYFEMDSETRIVAFYKGKESELFSSQDQFLGKKPVECMPQPSANKIQESVSRVVETRVAESIEYLLPFPGGDRWYEARLMPLPPKHVMAYVRDVSDRKRAFDALSEQSRLLEEAQQTAHLGNWDWNSQTNELSWSDELYRIYGLDPHQDNITFERFLEAVHPDDRDTIKQNCQCALQTGEPITGDERIRRTDGSERILYSRGNVVYDKLGQPVGLRGICQDVTEQRHEESRFRGLLEAAPDAMVIVDETATITLVNRQAESLFGYDRQELLGRPVELLVPQRLHDKHVAHRDHFIRQPSVRPMGQGLNLRAVHKDGSEFPVEISLSPLVTRGGQLITAAIRDISERIAAEEEVRRSRQHLDDAQRIASVGSWEWNPNTNETWWSDQIYRMYALKKDEGVPSLESFLQFVVPEDRQLILDGIQAALEHDAPYDVAFRVAMPDGSTTYHVDCGKVERDEAGQPIRMLGTDQDVTERRQIESRLRHAERLASLGTLAAGIAHEINNPLSAAWTAAETARAIKDKPGKQEMLDECFDTIVSAVKRSQIIIQNTLRFARQESSDKVSCELNEVVREAIATTQHYVHEHGSKIHLKLAKHLPDVLANVSEIEQVLVNLITNAVKAGECTSISLSTEVHSPFVRICVQDDGRGMTAEELARIFDPFYTAESGSVGTGLGLSISYGIVQDHGGMIDVESSPGAGSTFVVTIPIIGAADRKP